MNTAKLITLGLLRGSGAATDPAASFTVTTTGAQTLTINGLTVSASTTVDWGDGSSNAYTSSGARTHNYAGAGTWTVQILQPENVTLIDLRDTKITTVLGVQFAKLVNLTTVYISGLSVFNWTVGPSAPMPTGLTSLQFINTSTINWTVGPSAPMPTGLITLTIINVGGINAIAAGLNTLPAMTALRYENGLTTAEVDAVLAQLWAGFATRTATAGTIDLLGDANQGPTGPVAAENPPTYGGAYVHELVNDTGNVNPTHKWLSASTATPV